MAVNFVVGVAALFQYAAALLALRVLRITGKDPAWLLIAVVAFLMAVRRSIVLFRSLSHDVTHPPDPAAEWVALAISVFMLVGVSRIGPFFLAVLRSKEELRKRSYDLGERVKELNCLYQMAGLIEQPDVSLEQVIQGTAELIPPAWRYPELACARITLEGQAFATANFKDTPWKLGRDIMVRGKRVGDLEVCYREKPALEDEGLFPREEQHLVKAITERLGRTIERVRAEEDREMLQEQLHQAHKMEAIGLLAAGVAHDFSNLLTVIRGHADRAGAMLADGDGARKEVELIREATHRAADLTRALLTFGRKLPTDKSPIDLRTVVQESERLLHRVLPAAIKLDVDIASEPPLWVNADQTQVHQVILNLAINARDAMPDGGALRVSLSSMAESDVQNLPGTLALGGQLACLVVTDTGAGIPPEFQTRIFEPFYTTKPRGQGTGLGLSIVHGVIREHGGHIEVKSELGKGTTFTVFLPCIPSGEAAQQAAPAMITPTGKGELFLLAEDDQHVLGMIASTLDSLGYKVVLASDGVSVLEMYAQHAEDIRLLILDVDLPEKSGPECVKELRESGLNTPAIMITGSVDFDAATLDDKTILLRKPFGMPELASTVSEALGRDPGQEAQS